MPLALSLFATLLSDRAARVGARAARAGSTTERAPSVGTRFLTDLRADCTAQGMTGVALPLAPLARAWCEVNYPASADRKTPWATLESQIRVAAKAIALPHDVVVVSAKDAARNGLPSVALIVILPAPLASEADRAHAGAIAVDTAVIALRGALAARAGGQ